MRTPSARPRPPFRALWLLVASLAALGLGACNSCNEAAVEKTGDASAPAFGLTAEQAAREVAKVGDRTITLGEFAATLDRMDQFDRLRYQTKERRRELLQEMIDVELLAEEAKRRGLDKRPEVDEATRQILRDAMLAKARLELPAPAEIPAEEVRAYYEAHPEKFKEPERRRVAAIVLPSLAEAEKVLALAKDVKTPAEWGELVYARSLGAPKARPQGAAVELAGDLGIVGPPDDPRGASAKVPEAVRAAVFQIAKVGEIHPKPIEADGKFYVVRMNGQTGAHGRSLAEADRAIRVAILQEKMAEREKALEAELRKKIPVQIDDAALGKVKAPGGQPGPGDAGR